MKRFVLTVPLLLVLILSACTSLGKNANPGNAPISNTPVATSDSMNSSNTAEVSEMARTDEQGAVVFQVIPVNMDSSADTLEFNVAMNTHSVDLGMDLATLSTLSTDTDVTVQAMKWDTTPGGHHVEGKLIFPAVQEGNSVLDGASKLTLTIVNVDAASRVFEWELK